MKKYISIILAVFIFITLCACNSKVPDNTVFSGDDLAGKNIGVLLGSAATCLAPEYESADAKFNYYSSKKVMAEDLSSGELDCIITDKENATAVIKAASGLKKLDKALIHEEYSFVIAKENIDLTEDINSALAALSENGTLQKIIDNYILGEEYSYIPADDTKEHIGTLRLAVDTDFPPFAYYNDEDEIEGLDIDVAMAVCDILKVGLEIIDVPGEELVTYTQKAKADFSMGRLVKNDQDLEIVDFSDKYCTSIQYIIVRK